VLRRCPIAEDHSEPLAEAQVLLLHAAILQKNSGPPYCCGPHSSDLLYFLLSELPELLLEPLEPVLGAGEGLGEGLAEGLAEDPLLDAPLPDVPPELLLEELPPVVTFSSFRHLSRSAPVSPRHLLAVAPPEALPLPVAPPEALPVEPPDEELPVALLLVSAPPVALLLVSAPPVALLLASAPPEAPADEPELCASATLATAKSAATAAVPTIFNMEPSFKVKGNCGATSRNEHARPDISRPRGLMRCTCFAKAVNLALHGMDYGRNFETQRLLVSE